MNSPDNDIVVIGGGVVGCWTAWHLARAGRGVTVLERGEIGRGASFGNCGYICPSHVSPLPAPGAVRNGLLSMVKLGGALSIPPRWDPPLWSWLMKFSRKCNADDFRRASLARDALLRSSKSIYDAFAERHADSIKWQTRGLMTVYQSAKAFDAFGEQAETLRREFSLRLDRYEGDEVCRFEPGLREGLAGGWNYPDDAHLSPADLVAALRAEVEEMGVTIQEHSEVKALDREGKRLQSVLLSDGRRISAKCFVVSTGAEAGLLGRELGSTLSIIPGKGFSVTMNSTSQMPKVPMIFETDHVAVTPLGDSFRIGSTMQLTGFDRSIPQRRIELLKRSAREHLRGPLSEQDEAPWTGWRPMTPDGLPYIDRSTQAENVFVAAGNGMIGMASGAATGKLVAELVTGGDTHIDPTPFRIGRSA